MKARDKFGSYLVLGITAQIGIQTALNILVITDSIPNTGISLPFFSYGGTALFNASFEIDCCTQCFQEKRIKRKV